MQKTIIRNFLPSDGDHISELQARCLEVCPDTSQFHPGFYSSPAFDGGRNIFVAEDLSGKIVGSGLIYPQYASPRLDAYVFWIDLRVDPDLYDEQALKDLLLCKLERRGAEIRTHFTSGKAVLAATYFNQGLESIDYLRSRNFELYECVYDMRRDLSQPLPEVLEPEGLEVRAWRMETEAEQQAYLAAYQEAYGFCDWTLASLQHFMGSDMWSVGTSFAAFDGDKLVGSVLVYYRPNEEQNPERLGSTEHIFTAPEYRHRGVARCLISKGLAYLKERGLKAAALEVVSDNASAVAAYRACGYQTLREELSYARPIPENFSCP